MELMPAMFASSTIFSVAAGGTTVITPSTFSGSESISL
jgi:hypothetical protein